MTNPARKEHTAFLAELTSNLRQAQGRADLSAEERGRFARWIRQAAALDTLVRGAGETAAPATADELPPELLKELRIPSADEIGNRITTVLNDLGGSGNLDEILVCLYRRFGVIEKRRVVQNKLWRMVRKGQLRKAPKKRNRFMLESQQPQPKRRRSK